MTAQHPSSAPHVHTRPRVFLTGGTGLIGRSLQRALTSRGLGGTVLTRNPHTTRDRIYPSFQSLQGDVTQTSWHSAIRDHDVLIHLAGFPLFEQKWSLETKKIIHTSRVIGTKNLVRGIAALSPKDRPKRVICASAVGYYGIKSGDRMLYESSKPGDDFLANTAHQWEQQAAELSELTHLTIFRIGVVLSKEGGMLKRVLPIFRSGLGGRISSGKQWISWIHLSDVTKMMLEACLSDSWQKGVYNLCAPNPVTNQEFTKSLSKLLKRPSFIPVPEAVLRQILGEGSRYLVTGQRVSPKKLLDHQKTFDFPNIDMALAHLLRQ